MCTVSVLASSYDMAGEGERLISCWRLEIAFATSPHPYPPPPVAPKPPSPLFICVCMAQAFNNLAGRSTRRGSGVEAQLQDANLLGHSLRRSSLPSDLPPHSGRTSMYSSTLSMSRHRGSLPTSDLSRPSMSQRRASRHRNSVGWAEGVPPLPPPVNLGSVDVVHTTSIMERRKSSTLSPQVMPHFPYDGRGACAVGAAAEESRTRVRTGQLGTATPLSRLMVSRFWSPQQHVCSVCCWPPHGAHGGADHRRLENCSSGAGGGY